MYYKWFTATVISKNRNDDFLDSEIMISRSRNIQSKLAYTGKSKALINMVQNSDKFVERVAYEDLTVSLEMGENHTSLAELKKEPLLAEMDERSKNAVMKNAAEPQLVLSVASKLIKEGVHKKIAKDIMQNYLTSEKHRQVAEAQPKAEQNQPQKQVQKNGVKLP